MTGMHSPEVSSPTISPNVSRTLPADKSLRESSSFISDDILNYEPPSTAERRAKLRGSVDSVAPNRRSRRSGDISNPSSPCHTPSDRPGKLSAEVESLITPDGGLEFAATPSYYTWTVQNESPVPDVSFRFTIFKRTLVIKFSEPGAKFGACSTAILTRTISLPVDADIGDLDCTFHDGVAIVQVARKSGDPSGSKAVTSEADKPDVTQSTDEMMEEMSNSLEQNNSAAYDTFAARTELLRDLSSSTLPINDNEMPQELQKAREEEKAVELSTSPQAKLSDAPQAMPVELPSHPTGPENSAGVHHVPGTKGDTIKTVFQSRDTNVVYLDTFTSTQGESSEPAAEYQSVCAPEYNHQSHQPEPPSDTSMVSGNHYETGPPSNSSLGCDSAVLHSINQKDSDVLKRCQNLLKRSQEQSKRLLQDVSWPLTPEGHAQARYSKPALLPAPGTSLPADIHEGPSRHSGVEGYSDGGWSGPGGHGLYRGGGVIRTGSGAEADPLLRPELAAHRTSRAHAQSGTWQHPYDHSQSGSNLSRQHASGQQMLMERGGDDVFVNYLVGNMGYSSAAAPPKPPRDFGGGEREGGIGAATNIVYM